MARLRVVIAPRAATAIAEAAAWWAENRPAAPGAVRIDVERALDLLAMQPGIGTPCRGTQVNGVRRLLLGRLRYFVYYRVNDDTLEVLAFWHEQRGRQPFM